MVPRPESSPDHASLGTKTVYSESAAHAAFAKPLPPGVHPAGVQYRMLTYSGGKSLSLSERTRRGSTRWEACAAEGQGGRSPAPVRKPGIEVAGCGAFGLVRRLEEPLPRAAAASVLEQQQPALLPCVAAAVARGSGCGAKPRQRRRAGAFRTLGYARPIVQVAPERSRAVVRRIFTTGDGQGAEEESDTKTHLRARYTTPFKALG